MSQNEPKRTDRDSSTLPASRRQFLQAAGFTGLVGLTTAASTERGAAAPSNMPGEPGAVQNLSEYIEAPGVFAENQEPPRVHTSVPFSSVRGARDANEPFTELESRMDNSEYFQSLNGNWDFAWYQKPADVPDSYTNTDWNTVAVPGCWQTQGYDTYVYVNTPLTWTGIDEATNTTPPKVPNDYNPVGTYRRDFTVPADWSGRESFLNFEGVKQACFVWIDDQYVGYNQGSMTSAEFDVTDYVSAGEDHELTVQVYRFSDGEALETQDMFRFSGIYRSVYLYSTPSVHLRDFFIRTDLDNNYKHTDLSVDAELANYTGTAQGNHTVRGHLFDSEGTKVTTLKMSGTVDESAGITLSGSTTVPNPEKWSAETPALYTIVLEHQSEGTTTETMFDSVGFREYSISDQQFRVNGEPVDIRGVNSMEHDPEHGRTVPLETQKKDFELMKRNNINGLRCSHYPRDPTVYYLADEYGLYLEDEVNVETHWNTDLLGQSDEWDAQAIERFRRMVQSEKNRPSIFMWGTGNEAGLHDAHFEMAEFETGEDEDDDGEVLENYSFDPIIDHTRFLYHQANNGGVAPYAQIDGPRYPSPGRMRSQAVTSSVPLIMGEYAHAMGNSGGLFHDFWEIVQPDAETVTEMVSTDRSTQNNNGTLVGDPQILDEDNGAIVLDGNDYEDIGETGSLDFEKPGFTLWARVKGEDVQNANPYIARGDNQYALKIKPADPSRDVTVPSLEFFIYDRDDSYQTVRTPVPDNWANSYHDIVGVATDSTLKIFVDGELLAEEPHNASTLTPTDYSYPFTIGYNAQADRYARGSISQVRVYNQALSNSEVTNGAGETSPTSSTVLWMDFDEFTQNDTLQIGEEYASLQGGFVWDWVDQGIHRTKTERIGFTTPDTSESDYTGVLWGNPDVVDIGTGKGIVLDGNDDYVDINGSDQPSDLNFTEPGFSISARVKTEELSAPVPLVAKGNQQYALKIQSPDRGSKLELFIYDDGYISVTADLPDNWSGNWHTITGVCDDSELRLYVDGTQLATKSHSALNISSDSSPVRVGNNSQTGQFAAATIDEIEIYDRPLSSSEVGTNLSDAVLRYPFDSFDMGHEETIDYRFYDGDPFCLNGVVFGDRTPQPQLEQLKKSHQPVGVAPENLTDGDVRITNHFDFANLSSVETTWELRADDEQIQSGSLSPNIAPGENAVVNVPFDKPELKPGVEYWLTIRFATTTDTPWADKGSQIAFDQLEVPFDVPEPSVVDTSDFPKLSTADDGGQVTVSADSFEYVFSKEQGTLSSGTYNGIEVVSAGPLLDFFRAPIQNELQNFGPAESSEWYDIGLDDLQHEVMSVEASQIEDSVVHINVKSFVSGAGSDAGFDTEYRYKIFGSGDILLGVNVNPNQELVDAISYWLPRVGVAMDVPNTLAQFEWYGRGPHETYPDRKWGAEIDVHSGTVADQFVPYQPPSDNGNKTDTRWAALVNDDNVGLASFGKPEMNVELNQYKNLEEADHVYELEKKEGVTTVHLDHAVTGVGGTPVSALEQYRVNIEPMTFLFGLRPFEDKRTGPPEHANKDGEKRRGPPDHANNDGEERRGPPDHANNDAESPMELSKRHLPREWVDFE